MERLKPSSLLPASPTSQGLSAAKVTSQLRWRDFVRSSLEGEEMTEQNRFIIPKTISGVP